MAKRRKRRGNFFVRLFVFGFIGYIAFTLVCMQLEVTAKRRELLALEQGIEQQKLMNAETERLLQLEKDEEYIERMARDKLGFAYPDEKIYVDRLGS